MTGFASPLKRHAYIQVVVFLTIFLGFETILPAYAEPFTMSFPVQCALNETCFIQNYVDTDPTADARDYRCGLSTYNGHKGTDIRILSTADARRTVAVVAVAPGQVKAVRDGVADRLVGADISAVPGKECGNGVIIGHGQGRVTQYCHMRRGSVRVQPGQQVDRGETIGSVGFSGNAQFAHLELTVRIKDRIVDPFTGRLAASGCGQKIVGSLWQASAGDRLQYRRGQLIESGFVDRPVGPRDLEAGKPAARVPGVTSKALIFFARFINLEKGDRVRLVLEGPSGNLARSTTKRLDRHKAQYVAYLGKKLRARRWESGRYRAVVKLVRDGVSVLEKKVDLTM